MKRDWYDKEFRVMFTMGASVTAGGWASCRERSWAKLLAEQINQVQRTPVQLVNMGIGANALSPSNPAYTYSSKPSASERLDRHILKHHANYNLIQPDLLVLSYALIEVRAGTPIDTYIRELHDLIRRVRENIQPVIVLLGPYFMTDFERDGPWWNHASPELLEQYNHATHTCAEETDCLFVDLLRAYNHAGWLVHHDGCHANDLGHRVVANEIFRVLATNCSGLAKEPKTLEESIPPWRDESTLQQ